MMRSTVTLQVGDRDPWQNSSTIMCETEFTQHPYICTAPDGHDGPHVASDGDRIVAVQADPNALSDLTLTCEFYTDRRGEYRFRVRSDINGNIITVASQGYNDKRDRAHAADITIRPGIKIIDLDEETS